MAENAHPWGRVTDDGTVEVLLGDTWLPVGSYPDATPDEALALFVRKGEELESQVGLAEQRLKAGAPARDVLKALPGLRAALETPKVVADVAGLRKRLEALESLIEEAASQQAAEREKAVEAAVAEREKLVAQIEGLAAGDLEKIRWKEATAQVDELFSAWKAQQQSGPKLPKATADTLWKRFRNARHTLDRARRAHFQARDKIAKEAKGVKRELIDKAQALADKGAAGIPAYRELLEAWKRAPRGTRQVEDQLWAQFKAAGDVLYQAKTAEQESADAANADNGERKLALVEEFSDIVQLSDHRQALERLRLFHERFRLIGPVPRAMVKVIDQKVIAFDKHVKKLEAEHWEKTNPEKQARNNSFLEQLTDQIAKLEEHKAAAEAAGDPARASELADDIATKRAWRDVLTGE